LAGEDAEQRRSAEGEGRFFSRSRAASEPTKTPKLSNCWVVNKQKNTSEGRWSRLTPRLAPRAVAACSTSERTGRAVSSKGTGKLLRNPPWAVTERKRLLCGQSKECRNRLLCGEMLASESKMGDNTTSWLRPAAAPPPLRARRRGSKKNPGSLSRIIGRDVQQCSTQMDLLSNARSGKRRSQGCDAPKHATELPSFQNHA
jgi:hypothetical protein